MKTFTKRLLINQTPPLHPVSYQPPTHRRLLVFPVFVFIIGEDSFVITSRPFGIHSCLQCVFQCHVNSDFLGTSSCCQTPVKTHSIPPPNPGQPSYRPFYHIHSNERSNDLLWSHNRWFPGEKYRSPPLSDNWMCQTYCVRTWPKYTVERYT
jgi:hypothetical protein